MYLLYHIGLYAYAILVHALAIIGHKKASLWVNGRKGWEQRLEKKFQGVSSCIWIHCASLGEYELSVPLIHSISEQNPGTNILVTFFSPSGYEVKKNDKTIFHVDYLPLDSAYRAQKFIQLVKPNMVFFAKYDYWYHYLNALSTAKVPTYVFSATFRPSQLFFKRYGRWYLNMLKQFTLLFVTDENSKILLDEAGIKTALVAGDTRFDRVASTAIMQREIPYITSFKSNKSLLVAGSTWPEDEHVLIPFINDYKADMKYIVAPHEIKEDHLKKIERSMNVSSIRYSQITPQQSLEDFTVLIIDNIGMLSAIYKYGDIAYVGGAFKQGLHNILEPLSFGLPVLFGPEYKKFPEAELFINLGGAFSILNSNELSDNIKYLSVPTRKESIFEINRSAIEQYKGATAKILNHITWKN